MKEFNLIEHFFKQKSGTRKDVVIGIGDDAAVTHIPQGQALVTTTDTLLSGVHFLPNASPHSIAQKAVAVNLSDLAAMGAEPAWISLSLSAPDVDEEWLTEFSRGLQDQIEYYSIQLIGGDTVQGPLAITITAQGFVPYEQAITRSGAKPGDLVYVTGTLGDAGLGLAIAKNEVDQVIEKPLSQVNRDFLLKRLNYPTPRLLTGTQLRRIANSCIDLSDGLISDIKHILKMSACGATLDLEKLPLSQALVNSVDEETALKYALSAGDDYELLFTVSEEQKGNLETTLASANIQVTCIGHLNGNVGNLELKKNNLPYQNNVQGYQHF
ncbi:thiamine-phosphate kinase [Paraglaciecola aquimarina]|uniref:Thiamine-monophosphate kinase n=1 Tax=Paraglaciecola algarum TaxID=3050085 RepID=A0ABS9D746_9ALTE|nr:thiamine-phosphate kinase [Paraglaciecola sp. G1-23]